jgi:thermostable 8-oxoguanine DNA glycosylase
LDTVRTAKMKSLYEITNCLLNEMVKENDIELSNYLKPQPCTTLNDVYEQALSSLCNRQGMKENIKFERNNQGMFKNKKFEERHNQLKEILSDFEPKEVKKEYDKNKGLESLIDVFNEKLSNLNKKINSQKNSQWKTFAKGAISAAIFLSEFQDKDQFDVLIKDFQRSKYTRKALPMLLDKEISGFGFALACDFLKEAGYDGYPKADVHLMDVFEKSGLCERNDYQVFETVKEVAKTVGKTPYEVDKRIWLVCSGNFYKDKKVDDKKKELLRKVSE